MEQKVLDQIHLCINELQMVKQLIDTKAADDFCSRMLGIYAMMRVDDITKIWGHSIPKSDANYAIADNVKNMYNQGLRTVRDKLGAHYQTPAGTVDLFASVEIFKSIDYANTVCLIDEISRVQLLIEGCDVVANGMCETDLRIAKGILEELYSDDQAYLTCGALDTFGINKGGVMTMSEPQVKGQYLRSIEVMVDVAKKLFDGAYSEIETKRLFKRLYVCTVFNYHDNLITRKDINEKTVQYEEGLDRLFPQLITINDNKVVLEKAFDQFEDNYQIEPFIKKYRKVRDHACAHFDESSTVVDINKELDLLDTDKLSVVYGYMLNMFNYIANNVFLLKAVTLPARVPIYGVQMETAGDIESFYGEKPAGDIPATMGCVEIMRAIRKNTEDYGVACDALHKKLMSHDEEEYQEMVGFIAQRLREPSVSNEEQTVIILALKNAKRGFPERLQRTLVSMINDKVIFKLHDAHLLWLLSSICREDKNIDMMKLLDSIIIQQKIIPTSMAMLALLHMTVEKRHSCFVGTNKAHEVAEEIKNYCESVKNPTEKCLLMIVLSQHWFWDRELEHYRCYETEYTEYFQKETEKALDSYFTYIKLQDQQEIGLCKGYLKKNLLLLVLYRLAYFELERKQTPNLYMEAWRFNCFVRTKCYIYEAFGVGLMEELMGNKESAKYIFEDLVKENPIHRDAIKTLEDFYKRNPDMKR